MQTKRILFILILATSIVFNACGPSVDLKNIYGTWVKINDKDVDDIGEKEELILNKNGSYKVTHFNKDSIDASFDGTFELDAETNQIKITNEGYRLKNMTVIKLTRTHMTTEISEEYEGTYTLNYRRQ